MSISIEYYCSKLEALHLLQKATILLKRLLLPFTWFTILNTGELPTLNRSGILRKALKDNLHISTYDELTTTDAAEETSCVVCLSEVRGRDHVWELRNCNHVFHKGCLDTWLDHDENLTCPLCRAPLLTRMQTLWVSATPVPEPSWEVERLLYLFGDDSLLS